MVDGRRNWVNSFRVIQCSSIPPSTIQRGDSSLMFFDNQDRSTRVALAVLMFSLTLLLMVCGPGARAQTPDITSKLTWDRPVRESVPAIQFYNDQLNNNVPLRDMLSHRTGVTRHDLIWFKSPFTRKELFEKLKYLEPQEPMRETFLYNNLMYSATGQIIELKSGKRWEEFVREKIFTPLEMGTTSFTISDMTRHADHGVPYREKRDSFELYKIPYYEDTEGVAPAGAIISNIDHPSHWP